MNSSTPSLLTFDPVILAARVRTVEHERNQAEDALADVTVELARANGRIEALEAELARMREEPTEAAPPPPTPRTLGEQLAPLGPEKRKRRLRLRRR